LLQIKTVIASEVKIGDRIIDPNVIKPYLTEEGFLPDELAEAFTPVLAVGVLKDIEIGKRNELIKNSDYSLDTVIIMVKLDLPDDMPKILTQFVPNGTMNQFHTPSDIIMVLQQERESEDDVSENTGDTGDFNLECDDWHPCSCCKYHQYIHGKNMCTVGNCCDDYDEENPCGDME
jgi:hypothetical protein